MNRPSRGRRIFPLVCGLLGLLLTSCAVMREASTTFQKASEAQRSYDQGLALSEANRHVEAIPHFRQALRLYPDFDEAEASLAWSLYHTGQYSEGARHFREGLKRQPQWEGLHDGLGWCLYRQGRYPAAAQAFRDAMKLDTGYRDAGVGLAYSLFESGRYAEALPLLERLTREGERGLFRSTSKDVEEVRSRLAWTLYYVGQYARAREEFRRGVAARPEWYGLYNGLGWASLRLGSRTEARQSFAQALRLKPDYTDAKAGLAQSR